MIRQLALAASAVLLLATSTGAQESSRNEAPDWQKALRLRGRFKEEFAYRLPDPSGVSKLKTVGWLESKYDFSESVNLRLQGRAWWDGAFEVTDRYPREVERDQQTDLSLRQALLSISAGPFDVRLGRQQIVWGEAISTFVTDVVNPKDFREFVLPEFSEIRIPLWALDASYTFGKNLVVEAVWTPDLRFSKIPKPGAEFEFFRQPSPPNSIVILEEEQKPSVTLGNSQGGGRISYLISGWDLSLLYYDGFDPTIVLFRRQTGSLPNGTPIFALTPSHPRLHMIGGTVGKSIEPVVIRGEVLYTIGKLYGTSSLADTDGVVRRDTLDYLLSLDYTFFEKLETTWQFTQKILMGSPDGIERGAVEGRVTSALALRISTGFLDDTLNPSALFVVNVNRGDYRISPKLEYLLAEAVTITFGADFFGGPQETLYGQFNKKDRVYTEITYRF